MKRVLLVLLLTPIAHAKILGGSAVCASEQSADFNIQFAWDDAGSLTSAALINEKRGHLFDFQIERDTKAFVIAPDRASLDLRAPTGESIKMDVKIDDHGLGSGSLDWKIPTESFDETGATAMCSF